MIRWYVNRIHVATSDKQIMRDFYDRMRKAELENRHHYTREERKSIYKEALEQHHYNQQLYYQLNHL